MCLGLRLRLSERVVGVNDWQNENAKRSAQTYDIEWCALPFLRQLVQINAMFQHLFSAR